MHQVKYMKYGGVKFRPLVKPSEINRYVREISQNNKDSMFEVAKELQSRGMIEIISGDFGTEADDSCF